MPAVHALLRSRWVCQCPTVASMERILTIGFRRKYRTGNECGYSSEGGLVRYCKVSNAKLC
jgi:hypothetical protein